MYDNKGNSQNKTKYTKGRKIETKNNCPLIMTGLSGLRSNHALLRSGDCYAMVTIMEDSVICRYRSLETQAWIVERN